ncbi:MAG: transposase [Thermomicrobiales bacterium]|nr:transposase [Thermomicrobiales bacterium]
MEPRRRTSIRLANHDYTSAGAYFVTICVEGRLPLFGEITNGAMEPTIAGLMVESWWGNIERRFPTVLSGPFVVMPNHCHGIVVLGAIAPSFHCDREQGDHIGSPLQTDVQQTINPVVYGDFVGAARRGRPAANHDASIRRGPSLPEIVGWFKTMTTNDYGLGVRQHGFPPFNRRLWQHGYYDHIIRTEAYIETNPERWNNDELNPFAT